MKRRLLWTVRLVALFGIALLAAGAVARKRKVVSK